MASDREAARLERLAAAIEECVDWHHKHPRAKVSAYVHVPVADARAYLAALSAPANGAADTELQEAILFLALLSRQRDSLGLRSLIAKLCARVGWSLDDALFAPEPEVERLRAEHAIMRRELIGYPNLKCINCGYYTSGTAQFPCRNCGEWHYWTGIGRSEFGPDSEWGRKWLTAQTEAVDHWLSGRVAAVTTQPGTDTAHAPQKERA